MREGGGKGEQVREVGGEREGGSGRSWVGKEGCVGRGWGEVREVQGR